MIPKPADNELDWGPEVRALIGAVNAQRTVRSFEPPPGLTAIESNGSDQSSVVQAHLDYVKNTYGGGWVDLRRPGASIRLNSRLTLPSRVAVLSDEYTELDFSGSGNNGGAFLINDSDWTPLVGCRIKGPSGDARNSPDSVTDLSTGLDVTGVRLRFFNTRVLDWNRGIDLANSNTFSVTFSGGDIGYCRTPIYADATAEGVTENGEAFRFDDLTIYNNVYGPKITGNNVGAFFTKCQLDYMLREFGRFEDSTVHFNACHIEGGGSTAAYYFNCQRNPRIFFTGTKILMGQGTGSPNPTRFLFNTAQDPWNIGWGQAAFSTCEIYFVDVNGSGSTQLSSQVLNWPANTATLTFYTAYPLGWIPVSARFVAQAGRTVPNADKPYVSAINTGTGQVTLTAPTNGAARWVRVDFG